MGNYVIVKRRGKAKEWIKRKYKKYKPSQQAILRGARELAIVIVEINAANRRNPPASDYFLPASKSKNAPIKGIIMPMPNRNSHTAKILMHFEAGGLSNRPKLWAVAKMYQTLAMQLEETLPGSPEKTVTLRKLLESRDAALRSVVENSGSDIFGAAVDHHFLD